MCSVVPHGSVLSLRVVASAWTCAGARAHGPPGRCRNLLPVRQVARTAHRHAFIMTLRVLRDYCTATAEVRHSSLPAVNASTGSEHLIAPEVVIVLYRHKKYLPHDVRAFCGRLSEGAGQPEPATAASGATMAVAHVLSPLAPSQGFLHPTDPLL